jgi:DNA-directed RNA polymerase specialized sigma24 family protein
MPNEQELLRRVVAGDASAEAEFIALFRPRLLRTCAYLLDGAGPAAEEVVEETFRFALPRLGLASNLRLYDWLRQNCLRLCYVRLRGDGRITAGQELGDGDPGPE